MSGMSRSVLWGAILAVLLMVAIAVAVAVWHSRGAAPRAQPAAAQGETATAAAGAGSAGTAGDEAGEQPGTRSRPATSPPVEERPEPAATLAQAVASAAAPAPRRVQAEQVVAQVNGEPILGRDLLPFGAGEPGEQSLTPEHYDFLRRRAIDRALVLGAARERGLALGAGQAGQLEQLRQTAAARGVTDPAQLEFERHDAQGNLLLDALVAQRGGAPPYAGPEEIQRYYEEHRDEFDELPEEPVAHAVAWQKIELQIRQVLSGEMQQAHTDSVQTLLAELRAAATITDASAPAPAGAGAEVDRAAPRGRATVLASLPPRPAEGEIQEARPETIARAAAVQPAGAHEEPVPAAIPLVAAAAASAAVPVAVDARDARIAELEAQLAAALARIQELEARPGKKAVKPAKPPAAAQQEAKRKDPARRGPGGPKAVVGKPGAKAGGAGGPQPGAKVGGKPAAKAAGKPARKKGPPRAAAAPPDQAE